MLLATGCLCELEFAIGAVCAEHGASARRELLLPGGVRFGRQVADKELGEVRRAASAAAGAQGRRAPGEGTLVHA